MLRGIVLFVILVKTEKIVIIVKYVVAKIIMWTNTRVEFKLRLELDEF